MAAGTKPSLASKQEGTKDDKSEIAISAFFKELFIQIVGFLDEGDHEEKLPEPKGSKYKVRQQRLRRKCY